MSAEVVDTGEISAVSPILVLGPVTANLDPPNQFPRELIFRKICSPRELFCAENLNPLTKFGPPCHCVSFEQTIIYTWSIHTKEAIHNKFEVVYSSITHKEQNKLIFSMSSYQNGQMLGQNGKPGQKAADLLCS